MTSVKTMHTAGSLLALAWVLGLGGCSGPGLNRPTVQRTPYPDSRLWAVAPFANESGVSSIDTMRIADHFTHEAEQIDGIRTVPVNRVVSAMRVLKLESVTSESEAIALLNVLDVDGLVIGTVTAHDAYPPLQLGLAVELVTREDLSARAPLDPRQLARIGVGPALPLDNGTIAIAQASGVFDASNHATRKRLEAYSTGRSMPDSAYEGRIYDVSMDLYTRFVSYALIGDLLASEQYRLVRVTQAKPPTDG